MASTFYKPVTSTISTRQESSTGATINGSLLTYTLCDRTVGNDKTTNYFMSFNLPVTYSILPSGSTLAMSHPETLQINVDKITIIPIPKENYSELIDGRSITLKVAQNDGVGGVTYKTLVSSTYSTLQKRDSNVFLGSNLAFLFSDDVNLPYSGTSNGGSTSHSANSTWNTTVNTNRPAATSYSDLSSSDINTDKRPNNSINYASPVTSTYPTNTNQGYNYDIPVGYVCLDKGFIVITHPNVVNNIPWGRGFISPTGVYNSSSATTEIYFSSATSSELTFTDISISYKTSAVCIGLPGEFYFTNNPSWDLAKNTQEFNNSTNNFDSLWVTEVGLYNMNNELIAVAKLSEPVEKSYVNLLTFNLDINV